MKKRIIDRSKSGISPKGIIVNNVCERMEKRLFKVGNFPEGDKCE
jgi:hypothetical protein